MESFGKLKRRTTDLMGSLPQNLPSMPNIHMPHMPHMPQLPHLPKRKAAGGMKGTWEHIDVPHLGRSSHTLDVVEGRAYIFGGEVDQHKSLDNDMHVITLPANSAGADYYAVKPKPSPGNEPATSSAAKQQQQKQKEDDEDDEDDDSDEEDDSESDSASETSGKAAKDKGKGKATAQVPCARIGHASAVIGTRIFLFGGRRTTDASSTLDEGGRVWVFETKTNTWTYLDPHHSSPVPPPRSYFAAVATDKPRDFAIRPLRRADSWKQWAEGDSAQVGIPQRPIAGNVAATATDEEDAGFGTLIIHGGCLAGSGDERTSDVWAFDIHTIIAHLPLVPSLIINYTVTIPPGAPRPLSKAQHLARQLGIAAHQGDKDGRFRVYVEGLEHWERVAMRSVLRRELESNDEEDDSEEEYGSFLCEDKTDLMKEVGRVEQAVEEMNRV